MAATGLEGWHGLRDELVVVLADVEVLIPKEELLLGAAVLRGGARRTWMAALRVRKMGRRRDLTLREPIQPSA